MTDFKNIDITLDPLLSQGARFNQMCRVYAPLYRQKGVVPKAEGSPGASVRSDLGLTTWEPRSRYYLENFSGGRKFVLSATRRGPACHGDDGAETSMPEPDVRAR